MNKVWVDLSQEGYVLNVYETLKGNSLCNCVCSYDFDTTLTHLRPGAEYTVRVYVHPVDDTTPIPASRTVTLPTPVFGSGTPVPTSVSELRAEQKVSIP
jgi:hypothetical protein